MTEPGFEIVTDPRNDLIRATLNGYWDLATVARYDVEIRRAHAALAAAGCGADSRRVLIDVRNHQVQSQEVVAALTALRASTGKATHRLAVVVGGVLQKLQSNRVNAEGRDALFTDLDAAIAYLLSPIPPTSECRDAA